MKATLWIFGIVILLIILYLLFFYKIGTTSLSPKVSQSGTRFVGGTACTSVWYDANGNKQTCNGYTRVDNNGYTYCDCKQLVNQTT